MKRRMKAPNLISVDHVIEISKTSHAKINDQWVPARPMGLFSIISRIKLAFGVFVGKYDALYWNGQ